VVVFYKSIRLVDVILNDPEVFDCESLHCQGLNNVRVKMVEHSPPSIVKDESYAFDEVYLSHYCRFTQLVWFMPPLGGVEIDLDLEVKFRVCDGGLSNGVHYRLVVYINHSNCKYFMLKKDLHPICLT